MKKLIVICASILIALWLLLPSINAAFTPRTEYYSQQQEPVGEMETAPHKPYGGFWDKMTPEPSSCILIIPARSSGRVPYAFPPGCPIAVGMPTMEESEPDLERVEMLNNVTDVSIGPQQEKAVIAQPVQPVAPQPVKDWTNELTAVNRNLENAVEIVELCAIEKVKAALEMPPRLVNCQAAVDNLETAKEKVYELSAAMAAGRGE